MAGAVLRLATSALTPPDRRALEPMLETALAAITTDAAHAERICRLCDVASCPVETCPAEYGTDSATFAETPASSPGYWARVR